MDIGDLEGKRLKKNEVKELLTDKDWVKDKKLTKFFGEADTYFHPDKNLVLSVDWDGNGGMLFLDKEAVYQVVSDPDALKAKHMLQGVFNYGNNFPEQSSALSEIFSKKVLSQAEGPVENYSMESFRFIDDHIAKNGTQELFHPEVFASLLAYVGESVIKNYSMDWSMIKVEKDLWEPWLVDKTGNQYPIFAPVYKELYNYRQGSSSLYGAIVGEIQKHKLQRI